MRIRHRKCGFASVAVLAAALIAPFAATVKLRPEFVDQYRHRVTISATLAVDGAHNTPNSLANDGDIHIAGRSPDIGLRVVAEPMNAYEEWRAVILANQLEETGGSVSVTGVYRIWPEHSGAHTFTQGEPLDPQPGTNPDHIFEIHPLTKFGPYDMTHMLRMIPGDLTGDLGFKYQNPVDAFARYNSATCTIKYAPGDEFYEIEMSQVGYNYVAMAIVPDFDTVMEVEDGTFVEAKVFNWAGDEIEDAVRMVFVRGSEAERALQNSARVPNISRKPMRVLAMPRLSFQGMWQLARDNPGSVTAPTPFEMIVVGYAGIARRRF